MTDVNLSKSTWFSEPFEKMNQVRLTEAFSYLKPTCKPLLKQMQNVNKRLNFLNFTLI